MKFPRALLAGIAALVAVSALAPNAFAANQVMCAAPSSSALPGPQRVVNPNTGNVYALGNRGCALIALADIGYFQSQGYTQGSNQTSVVYNTGVPTSTTQDFTIGTVPAGAYIREIIVSNSVATSVTGGIQFGTTANATDVVTALTCASSCLANVTDANLKTRLFSTTVAQAIHMSAMTSWQAANVTVTMILGFF